MSDISSATVSTKFRRGTSFAAKFPTLPSLSAQPRRIDLYQKQFTHDILVMEFSSVSPLWFESMQTGIPVQVVWQQDTLVKNWIGYISSVSKVEAPQRQNSMEVMCVGATFPLKERTTKVFTNTTIPQAVKEVVESFGFNFIGEPNSAVFEQLTIAGTSYWQWIQEQAQRIGYGVIVDGMNFFFRPLDSLINQGFSNAPVLSMGDTLTPFNTQFKDRTLDNFKITKGDNVESSKFLKTIKNTGGVDPVSGQIVGFSQSPSDVGVNVRLDVSEALFSDYQTGSVTNTANTAEAIAKGAAELSRFSIPARVKCQGDPRIRPFGTVYINGTGKLSDGYWVVQEAHHMFHKIGDYIMELRVATDGVGETRKTEFRNRDSSLLGTINLEEALSSGKQGHFFEMSEVSLNSTITVISEGQQRYGISTNVWKGRPE